MKVGQQRTDDAEAESRINKDVRLSRSRRYLSFVHRGDILECSHCGCSYGDDPEALVQGTGNLGSRSFRNVEHLAMQLVFFHPFCVNGLKSSQADVQCDLGDLNAAISNLAEDFRSKVQACCGRGNAAPCLRPRVHRLIPFAVFPPVSSADVRRQRYVAKLFERSKEVRHRFKLQRALPKLASGDDLRHQSRFVLPSTRLRRLRWVKENLFTNADFPAWTNQGLPLPGSGLPGKQHLHLAVQKILCSGVARTERLGAFAGAPAEKPCREHAAVVDHQEVARAKQEGKIPEVPVLENARIPMQMKQTGGAAVSQRLLSNELLGKLKIEV